MLKSLFIIPMAAPMVISVANASTLPDEINYAPYESSYNSAERVLNEISNDLADSRVNLENLLDDEEQLIEDIQALEDRVESLSIDIANLSDEREDLFAVIEELEFKKRTQGQRLRDRERERQRLDRQLQRELEALAPVTKRLKKVAGEVAQAERELAAKQKLTGPAKAKLNKIRNEISKLKREITQEKAKVKSANQTIKDNKRKIKLAENSISTIEKNELPPAKAARDAELAKVNKTKAEMKVHQDRLQEIIEETGSRRAATRHPDYRPTLQKLRPLQQKLAAQNKVLARVQKSLDAVTTKISNIKRAKTNLENTNKTQARVKANAEKAITQKTKTKENKEVNEIVAQADYDKANADEAAAQLTYKDATQRLAKVQKVFDQKSKPANEIKNEIAEVNNRINRISRNLNETNQNLRTAGNRLGYLNSYIPNLRRNLRSSSNSLENSNDTLEVVQNNISTTERSISRLEAEEAQAIADKDKKYQDYLSRYNMYNDKLVEAKEIGADQTGNATRYAQMDSDAYVAKTAKDLGTTIGLELANAQSNLWAAVRAEIEGYNNGFATGYSSEADQDKGTQEGTKAGIAAAQNHAQTVLKPQFFNKFYDSALKGEIKKIAKVIAHSFASENIELTTKNIKTFNEVLSGISALTNAEVRESNSISSDLDSSIRTFKNSLDKVLQQQSSLSSAGNVYDSPSVIPFETINCSDVYKRVQTYINACETEYKSIFKANYLAEYRANFNEQYAALFSQAVEVKRSSTLSQVYEADYDRFYPIAQASGISDGKDKIYAEAYSVAKNNAYNNELPGATSVAKAQASNEVVNWISNNAAVTVAGSSFISSELQGGMEGQISLELKNISARDLTKPIKVEITSSRNVVLDKKTFFVKVAKGNTTTRFEDIVFKVATNATSGDNISLKGKVTLPGGKYESTRIEKFEVQTQAKLNPVVDVDVKYDSTPRIKSGFGRLYIHNIDVDIEAVHETIPSGYKVEFVVAEEDKRYFKDIKNSSENTGKLERRNEKEVTFKYVLNKRADNKRITAHINFIYKGVVMQSKEITLKPH